MQKTIPFMKLSGAGNDFVVIDNLQGIVPGKREAFVTKLCSRRLSVGADGLLFVEPSEIADFRMRYFNADGGEVETCGNGARCIYRFAYVQGIAPKQMRFETTAGVYEAEILGEHVKVRMSDPKDIRLDVTLPLQDGEHQIDFANTGVPHVVFQAEDLENTDVFDLGRETRYHEMFQPAGTNANFVSVRNRHHMAIRTYERGVEDETLACGTGSIASAVVAALKGWVDPPVSLRTSGGFILTIHFDHVDDVIKNVYLEGDARIIYSGELMEDAWQY